MNRLIPFFILIVLSACSTQRGAITAGSAAIGGTGGFLAGKAIGGDTTSGIIGAGVGGLAGGIAGELLQGEDKQDAVRNFNDGYDQGTSDNIKRTYWLKQNLEKGSYAQQGRMTYYTLPGPELTEDGMQLSPHDVTIPIME